ncbi:IucA/IucC family protein [Cohnella mopanensis]|uniref:IucA/IucC family protein n=1 Tax=Cohnella mopanensis TaxID=2911966 RepID=UPI001EF949F1|nr:IucA/IucC family protein [Cohnella mopanensis]
MDKSITQARSRTAERQIMKDLVDALIAEQFFQTDDLTTRKLSALPELAHRLYPEFDGEWVYVGEICFLMEESYRQGHQWVADSPIYRKNNKDWVEVRSPRELCQVVLRGALSEEAYAHPGVAEFLEGLDIAIEQLDLSLERASAYRTFTPKSAYEWYVKGEMIASLRDRPFHPLSKAKIGFTTQDYEQYMAEFGVKTPLHWVAIRNDSVMKGCAEEEWEALDVLNDQQRTTIEKELARKGITRREYTVIPAHPWQLKNIILPDFHKEIADKSIIILDSQVGDFLATSSMRSLASPYASVKMLKLPISVKSLGAARYLPVVKLLNGLAGEKMFRQAVACDETLAGRVYLCEEKHWWGYMPPSMGLFDDHPRHLAAQLRIYPKEIMEEGYKIIPMSSLGGALNGSHFLTEILGGISSNDEVVAFYSDLAAMFYDITMRLFKVGIVPEIHGQNCCLVLKDNKVSGLLFRDHDSVRLHQPYLDKHGIQDPKYHIRPGYSNSLYNETLEKLIFYVQSLGTQVNLASIMEALSEAYSIPVSDLWEITESKLREALRSIDIPETDRDVLRQALFESETWPVKLIIRPLLEADGVPGAMPSGKGMGVNPFYIDLLVNYNN